MDPAEQARFDKLLDAMTHAMRLHGLRDKTIDSYRRTLYRVVGHFRRCPDDLQPDELKGYFAALLEQYSWSTIKVDLSSLQFFHRYVLEREMEWIKIIRPPRVRTLPDIPTREEVHQLINSVRKLRYRIFLLVVYSLGLRISEGLALEVADIDGSQRRVHIRDGKGGKDRAGDVAHELDASRQRRRGADQLRVLHRGRRRGTAGWEAHCHEAG